MKINQTTVEVARGSVLEQDVEAIVNAANTSLRGGGGVDGAIHRAAGPGLMDELVTVAPQGAKTGTVVVTGGHRLKQRFVFHTPGPVYSGGRNGEAEKLESCYRSCMAAADERGVKSIAFCSISTGVYRYPLDQAAPLAVRTVVDYLRAHAQTGLERVVFAMFSDKEYDEFARALNSYGEGDQ